MNQDSNGSLESQAISEGQLPDAEKLPNSEKLPSESSGKFIGSTLEKMQALSKRIFQLAVVIVAALFSITAVKNSVFPELGPFIEEFKMPASLELEGLTGEVFAAKLLDRTVEVQAKMISPNDAIDEESLIRGADGRRTRDIVALGPAIDNLNLSQTLNVGQSEELESAQNLEIPVPGLNISLDALIKSVLELTGLNQEPVIIGGEIVMINDVPSLSIRITNKPLKIIRLQDSDESSIDNLLLQGAEHIMETLHPLAAGMAYARSEPYRLEQLITRFWLSNPTESEEAEGFMLEGLYTLIVKKDCPLALEQFDTASNSDPKNWLPHYLSANVLATCIGENGEAQAKAIVDANDRFGKVIEIREENSETLMLWGQFLYKINKIKEADEKFNMALNMSDDPSSVNVNWGNTLTSLIWDPKTPLDFRDKALSKLQGAEFSGPEYASSYVNEALLLLLGSKDSEISNALQANISQSLNEVDTYLSNTKTINSRDDLQIIEQALIRYKEAVRYSPDYLQAYYDWAQMLLLGREDLPSHQFEALSSALQRYQESHPGGFKDYPILAQFEQLQRGISELGFKGVWEGTGENVVVIEDGEGWSVKSYFWAGSWAKRIQGIDGRAMSRVPILFDEGDTPFEPWFDFGYAPQTVRLIDPRKVVHQANGGVWIKYRTQDFVGEWSAGEKKITVTVSENDGFLFDLSELALPNLSGKVHPDAQNIVPRLRIVDPDEQYTARNRIRRVDSESELTEVLKIIEPYAYSPMVELVHLGEMRLLIEVDGKVLPEIWTKSDVKWTIAGKWEIEGGQKAEIEITNRILSFDMSAIGGQQRTAGELNENLLNVVEFGDNGLNIKSAEFTRARGLHLVFRNNNNSSNTPSDWILCEGECREGEWKAADASGATIIVTNETKFTVKIDGNEDGEGQIFPPSTGDKSSSISLVDVRAKFPPESDELIMARLLSPNLLWWDGGAGFRVYWQRVEESSSAEEL